MRVPGPGSPPSTCGYDAPSSSHGNRSVGGKRGPRPRCRARHGAADRPRRESGPRDLKPADIVLTSAGLRVIDFGIAPEYGLTLTDPGPVPGIPGFTPPEHGTGRRSLAEETARPARATSARYDPPAATLRPAGRGRRAQHRAAADRVGQRHPHRPARPGTTRRTHHRRRRRPRRPEDPDLTRVRGQSLCPLKHRRRGDWRDTPLATRLSDAGGEHVARYGIGPAGAPFQTMTGALVAASDSSPSFRKVVKTRGYR